MSVTTITTSGTLPLLSAGQTYVVTGSGVDVTAPNIYVGSGNHFTVEDGATIDLSTATVIGVEAINYFTLGADGTLFLPASLEANVIADGVTFASDSGGADLVLQANATINVLTSSIANFGYLDNIDFQGSGTPIIGDPVEVFYAGGLSTFGVSTSSGLETFTLMGDYVGDTFSVSADGAGGFNFTDETPCFAAGTRILTTEGEVPVEQLKVGDVAVLFDGQEAPIVFIGTRHVNLARHARPDTAYPIRFPAGALADGVPAHDLLLSPDHALFIDDVLVPAKDLVDGVMITQDKSFAAIRYYHVELEDHGILLAEGTPAESFLNLGHRGVFDNSDEPVILHPELMIAARGMAGVAPLVTGGEALAAIRTRLYARAVARGYQVVAAPHIALAVGQTILQPLSVAGDIITFALPAEAESAVLLTDAFTPAELDPRSADRRTLGVAIAEVLLDGKFACPSTVFTAADLHPRGQDETVNWTRGRTRLSWPSGTQTLAIRVTGWPKRWQATAKAA
jgi:hypothetical protein